MEASGILAQIDAEIAVLLKAKALLDRRTVQSVKRGRPARKTTPKKRTMSPEGRARIAAAQKARWAKAKKSS